MTSVQLHYQASEEWQPIDALTVEGDTQRFLDNARIARMKKQGINWNLFGRVFVATNAETGKINVPDGQHRIAFLHAINYNDLVPCFNLGTLNKKERAQAFIDLNITRKDPDLLNMFRVAIEANIHPFVTVRDIVDKHQFALCLRRTASGTSNRRDNELTCLGALKKACGRSNDHLDRVMTICERVWIDTPHVITQDLMFALDSVIADRLKQPDINWDTLQRELTRRLVKVGWSWVERRTLKLLNSKEKIHRQNAFSRSLIQLYETPYGNLKPKE